MFAIVLFVSAILTFIFGWISDKIGRKPLIMIGMLLGAACIYPFYMSFIHFGNPELEKAMRKNPAVVIADPDDCSLALMPTELKGHVEFKTSCDLLKSTLNDYSVSYRNERAPKGSIAKVKLGNIIIEGADLRNLPVSVAIFS